MPVRTCMCGSAHDCGCMVDSSNAMVAIHVIMYVYIPSLVSVPGQPTVSVTSITSTSISLSWSVPSGSVVTSYEVMWRALSSGDEANDDGGSETSGSITSTSYTIQELESNTVYSVTVTVTNAAGSTVSQPIIIPSMCLPHT